MAPTSRFQITRAGVTTTVDVSLPSEIEDFVHSTEHLPRFATVDNDWSAESVAVAFRLLAQTYRGSKGLFAVFAPHQPHAPQALRTTFRQVCLDMGLKCVYDKKRDILLLENGCRVMFRGRMQNMSTVNLCGAIIHHLEVLPPLSRDLFLQVVTGACARGHTEGSPSAIALIGP